MSQHPPFTIFLWGIVSATCLHVTPSFSCGRWCFRGAEWFPRHSCPCLHLPTAHSKASRHKRGHAIPKDRCSHYKETRQKQSFKTVSTFFPKNKGTRRQASTRQAVQETYSTTMIKDHNSEYMVLLEKTSRSSRTFHRLQEQDCLRNRTCHARVAITCGTEIVKCGAGCGLKWSEPHCRCEYPNARPATAVLRCQEGARRTC